MTPSCWHGTVERHGHIVETGGCRLHCVDVGEGRPVLMLHGWADSSFTWHRNVDAVTRAGFRAVMPDLPGMGRSMVDSPAQSFSVQGLASAVLHLADHLKLERCLIVGSSMGAAIGLWLCLRHPGRFQAGVVLDPPCFRPPRRPITSLPGMDRMMSLLGGPWVARLVLRRVLHDRSLIVPDLVREYSRPMARPDFPNNVARLSREFFSSGFDDMVRDYPRMEAPILVVWGSRDTWVPPAWGRRLLEALPEARLAIVDGCGHLPHMESPDVVNPLIIEFLAGVGS